MKAPETLTQAIVYFSDVDRCFEYAKQLRWPDGKVACPRCDSEKNSFIKTRRIWFCYGCQKQFTLKVGTIFEDSALGLDKWMTAVWMLVNCKNGISSWELHRSLGVTQKSAWFMLQRIRLALKDKSFVKLGGMGSEVEVDETFVGGRAVNMHKNRKARLRSKPAQGGVSNEFAYRYLGKTPVQGFLDREQRKIRATVIPNVNRESLQERILGEVECGSHIYTDKAIAYTALQENYLHEMVNHLETYVNGRVHTNGIENFWSLLKRSLRGTYVAVEPFHLSRYVDEQAFRYNTRRDELGNRIADATRFTEAMSQIVGRRLTYSELTGKDESPRQQSTGTGKTEAPF